MDTLFDQSESSRGLLSRLKIIETAERLYALHGIDAVSIREINKASGQRNGSAVQYHFGNREGLLEAIFALRTRSRNNERFLRLHQLKESSEPKDYALAQIVDIMIRPMFEGLEIGHTSYHRRFFKQVHLRHETMKRLLANGHDMGLRECFRLIRDSLPNTPARVLAQRYVHANAVGIDAAAQLEELLDKGEPKLSEADVEFHIQCCVDSVTAIFKGP